MKVNRRVLSAVLSAAVWAPPLCAAQGSAAGDALSFATRTDKTAVWVGDQFHYLITVDHSDGIQFVMENLNTDTINLEPFRVMNVASSAVPLQDSRERLFVDVTLAAFATAVPELAIPQLTLFYFKKDAAPTGTVNEGAAAESVTIPGPVIALRSTLPRGASDLRDAVTVTGWARNRWIVAAVGWTALGLLVVGVAWQAVSMVRHRTGRRGPDPRKAMAAIQKRWSQAVPEDLTDRAAVLDFYGRSYHDLKEYLGHLLDTPTEGLTAEDMSEELRRLSVNADLSGRAVNVLKICETVRDGPQDNDLIGDTARRVADDMRQIFQTGSRRVTHQVVA